MSRQLELTSAAKRQRLASVADRLLPFIERGELAGITTLTWHRGEIIETSALGHRDVAANLPMTRETRFRIASMTKPLTSVLVLMLMEEGKLRLDDPVTKWIPELANRRVLCDEAGAIDDTVAASRDITVEDLLTHRSGLAYAMFSSPRLAQAYDAALGNAMDTALPPDRWLANLGTLPLSYQPGERMCYGVSTDVLGFVAERIEGRAFGSLLRERLLGPLGMDATDFWVPQAQIDKVAGLYAFDETHDGPIRIDLPVPVAPPAFESGGAGLYSTADDYLMFARFLLDDGHADGVRLLKAETVRDMRVNRLTPAQRELPFIGAPTWAGMGFGLGLGVVDQPELNLLGNGRVGSFTWPGAWGTWWQADPVEQLIMIFMIQHYITYTPGSGAEIATGRGAAGRGALPIYQSGIYDAIAA